MTRTKLPPRTRGRPITKPDPYQAIAPRKRGRQKRIPTKILHVRNCFHRSKTYTKGYTKWDKQQQISIVSKVNKLFKKRDL